MLSSSRRVKKGPGRRPLSAKRQRFMELRERGWSILAAAREVGVSRTTGNNWSRGYKTYRHGQVVGFVAALEPLAVRQINSRFVSQEERIEIADLRHAGWSIRQIAQQLGRAPSTVSRELPRNAAGDGRYRPFDAHRRATARRTRNHRRRIDIIGELRQVVAELLDQRWSPQQISRHLRVKFAEQPRMWLCHESIYQAIYQPGSGLLRPSRLAPHHRSPLRTGRDHRRAHQRTERRRPRFEHPMLTINQRPFPPEGRPNLAIGRGSQEPHRDRHFGRADHQLHDAAAPPVGVALDPSLERPTPTWSTRLGLIRSLSAVRRDPHSAAATGDLFQAGAVQDHLTKGQRHMVMLAEHYDFVIGGDPDRDTYRAEVQGACVLNCSVTQGATTLVADSHSERIPIEETFLRHAA